MKERMRSVHYEEDQKILAEYRHALAKALQGYYVRIEEYNVVICPQGNLLRQKSVKRNGYIRYCNKLACKYCRKTCCPSHHKELDMSPRKQIIPTPLKRAELKAMKQSIAEM